jgi:Flp pilus assembly pilin Flp
VRFLANESGTSAIEYAVIAGFLSIFVVTAVDLLGQNVNNTFFTQIANTLP